MASLQNSRKLKAWKERIATTSNSSIVGAVWCHLDFSLSLFLAYSRSGSSTASLCLYFLQLSAFVEVFFIVLILILGSGDALMKWFESEINKKVIKVVTIAYWSWDRLSTNMSLWDPFTLTPNSLSLTHNCEVLNSQSFTKLWCQPQQQPVSYTHLTLPTSSEV